MVIWWTNDTDLLLSVPKINILTESHSFVQSMSFCKEFAYFFSILVYYGRKVIPSVSRCFLSGISQFRVNMFTFENKFKTPKCFFGHVACTFDKLPKIISIQFWKLFAQNPKKFINLYFFPIFFSQNFSFTCRMQFWRPCWKIFAQSPKIFCSKSNKFHKIIIFSVFSLQNGPLDT